MINIAVFASGSGTNAENLARLFNNGSRARITLVLCNRRKAGVFERMSALGVEAEYVSNGVWDNEPERIVEILRRHEIGLVVLAGFMHFVSPVIIEAYKGRIINIHPSLLPAHGGKGMYGHHVHEAVIACGDKESGVTVHYVTEEIDGGEIVLQEAVEVTEDDTAESLEAKIHPIEYSLYPRAVMKVVEDIERREGNSMSRDSDEGLSEDNELPPPLDELPPPVDESWAARLKINYDKRNIEEEDAERRHRISEILPPPGVEVRPGASGGSGQQPTGVVGGGLPGADEVMPSNYLVWAVLCTLCCCFVPGIVAIVFSSKVNSRWFSGDRDGARRASRQAEIWIIVSFCLGVLAASFSVPLQMFQQMIGL